MEFTQESFNYLKARNSELEKQVQSNKEFLKDHWLNESQMVAQVGSWSWDIVNSTVEWSEMMYTLLGLEPNQPTPSYGLALYHVHDDDKAAYEQALVKAMNNKEAYYFENRIVKADKTIINVISRGICICNEENELIRMVGTVQDITFLKQLLETNKQLEQFAYILSHDVKTPIRTIISFIELIVKKSYENLTEEGKQYFSSIEKGAKHLSALVSDILAYSKLNSPELNTTKVSITELVRAVSFDLNITLVEKKGKISIGWLPESINVDRIKIRQVLQNLISNAIKYSAPERKLTIDIYCVEETNQYVFYVKDNGIGVKKEHADTIFEPYTRINNELSFSGSGIGLSICKRLINLHNGEIAYLTNKDNGSCFHFSIPK